MKKKRSRQNFITYYNRFEPLPLSGRAYDLFFSNLINRLPASNIRTTLEIAKPQAKILITGPVGCGKTSILHGLRRHMATSRHMVYIPVPDLLNPVDMQTTDILICCCLVSILSLKEAGINGFPRSSKEFIRSILSILRVEGKTGFQMIETILYRLGTDPDTRKKLRDLFSGKEELLSEILTQICMEIGDILRKEPILFVDDLDKLSFSVLKQILLNANTPLTLPGLKMFFSFPLFAYYMPDFDMISDRFIIEFVHLQHIVDENGEASTSAFKKMAGMVKKRLPAETISETAMRLFIEKSGGLLRDFIQFVQDACRIAVNRNASRIDKSIAGDVVLKKAEAMGRVCDINVLGPCLKKISQTGYRDRIVDQSMCRLLAGNFTLKYGHEDEAARFSVHPCLSEYIRRRAA